MPTIPTWTLAIFFWLHMLATVVWVGSIVSISLLFLPAIQKILKPTDQLALIDTMQKRLEPIAWFSLGLLIVTGLFQMSANSHYDGFLNTSGQWSIAILIKHVLVAIMIVASAVQSWEVIPEIRRALMKKDKADQNELIALQKRETRLLRINLVLSVLILGATAIARAA